MSRLTSVQWLVVVLFLGWGAHVLQAQVVPYHTHGSGLYQPATGDYSGNGVGTHLGRHEFLGNVATLPTAHPFVFEFFISPGNPQLTTGANGDSLYFSGQGLVELIPLDPTFTTFSAVWSGTFTVEGGTGRFENVGPGSNPLQVVAINDPFTFADPVWTFEWTLDGSIALK